MVMLGSGVTFKTFKVEHCEGVGEIGGNPEQVKSMCAVRGVAKLRTTEPLIHGGMSKHSMCECGQCVQEMSTIAPHPGIYSLKDYNPTKTLPL